MTHEEQPGGGAAPADEAPGPPMHIHKPTAPKSLAEFLSEIGVIVVGIVIALGGEQTIEWLHWRHEVAETRAALSHELAGDVGVAQYRVHVAPCIVRRLTELKTTIDAHARGAHVRFLGPVGQPQFPHIHNNVWQMALASQTVAHMPLELRLQYASLYDSMDWLSAKEQAESEAWNRLTEIDDAADLGAEDWAALRQARAEAAALAEKVDANLLSFVEAGKIVNPMADRAAALGVQGRRVVINPASVQQAAAFCKPIL
jgi:hypothetical protein